MLSLYKLTLRERRYDCENKFLYKGNMISKTLNICLIAGLLVISGYAEDKNVASTMQNTDREISTRKALDSFTRIEQKDISTVDKFKQMFTEGKVTGQLRAMYAGYSQKKAGVVDTYATAIGGMLKYELASLHGFNAGVAITTSQDIGFATGDGDRRNGELSSDKGDYSELSEAYINYKNGGFNFRVGRQMFDTPLADSDDIRMVPNTFEAYFATYEIANFTFTAAVVQKWQGADAVLGYSNGVRLDSNWVTVGDGGTSMAGITYSDAIEFNAWYYDIPKQQNANKATYIDIGSHSGEGDTTLHFAAQYLQESEEKNSGVEADVYGALVEFVTYGVGLNLAYNKSKRHEGKRTFSGIGGGSLYTSMDTMILDEIAQDREAQAIVAGIEYGVDNWNFLYAYGDFKGEEDSAGDKAHIVEQNLAVEYNVNDEFVLAAIYVKEEDKENEIKTENDWDRFQVMVKYDF